MCVVSSPEKAEICRKMGADLVIDRNAEGYRFWKDEHSQDQKEWRRFGKKIRELTGGDDPPDIVFEHPGARDLRRERLRRAQGRHDRDLRVDVGLRAPVRQPLPVDEPQADRRLPLRELPRGMGGQPSGREGPRAPPPCRGSTRSPRPGRPRSTSTTTSTRQGRRAVPGSGGGGARCRRPREARPAHRRDQSVPRV